MIKPWAKNVLVYVDNMTVAKSKIELKHKPYIIPKFLYEAAMKMQLYLVEASLWYDQALG
jgi:hypothetical protein